MSLLLADRSANTAIGQMKFIALPPIHFIGNSLTLDFPGKVKFLPLFCLMGTSYFTMGVYEIISCVSKEFDHEIWGRAPMFVVGCDLHLSRLEMKNDLMHFSEKSLYRVNCFMIFIDTGYRIVHNSHSALFKGILEMFLNKINRLNIDRLCYA
jgi:hypothetical protein